VACDANAGFAARVKLTGPEIRDRLEFRRQFLTLTREQHLVAKGLEDTIAEELAEIGQRALKAYKVAQTMEADADEDLIPHLQAMQRALNRGRRKKVKKDDSAAAAKKGAVG
jgi:hypothetical protein